MIYVTMFAGEGRITSNNWQIRDRKSGEHHEFKETYGMFNAGVSDGKDHHLMRQDSKGEGKTIKMDF